MKIGQVVSSIEFSDAEKDRLGAALLVRDSRPLAMLMARAPEVRDPDFWRGAQKRFGITGFRPGHPAARKMVFRKALESVKLSQGSRNHDIWPLYRRSVVDHVDSNRKDLNRLLSTEDFVASEGSLTDQVLRCIRKVMPLYGVTSDQVRELYELWGFDRSDHIEDILTSTELDIDVIERMIARESRKVERDMEGRLDEIRTQLHAAIRQEAVDFGGEIERLNAELSRAITGTNSGVSTALEQVRKLQDALVQPSVSKGQTTSKQLDASRSKADEAVIQGFRGRIENLAGILKRHERMLADGCAAESRLVTRSDQKSRTATGTWEQILQRCRKACFESGYAGLSLAAVWSLVELLRRARAIVAPRATLPLGVLSAICEVEVKHIAASPLWIDGSDWKDSLDFIAGAAETARILVIHDFEVAIQDTYLIPHLRSWLSSISANSRNRVILEPAAAQMDSVSPRTLECGILLPHDISFLSELNRLTVGLQEKHEADWHATSPADALQYVESFNREYEQQLRQLATNCGADLPIEVAARFVSISAGLSQLMGHQESAQVASEVTILPWLRLSRGEAAARIMEETLRTAFGGS